MWSVVEKTALAEAEIEYQDYTSDTIYVEVSCGCGGSPNLDRRECGRGGSSATARQSEVQSLYDHSLALQNASVVIWTTHALDDPWKPSDQLFRRRSPMASLR